MKPSEVVRLCRETNRTFTVTRIPSYEWDIVTTPDGHTHHIVSMGALWHDLGKHTADPEAFMRYVESLLADWAWRELDDMEWTALMAFAENDDATDSTH